jgi:hypothetical protein
MLLRYDKVRLALISLLMAFAAFALTYWTGGSFDEKTEFIISLITASVTGIFCFATWSILITVKFEDEGVRQWLFLSERFIPWNDVIVKEFTNFQVTLASKNSREMVIFFGAFFWKEKSAVKELFQQKGLV